MYFHLLIPFVTISLFLAANGAPAIDPIYARGNVLGPPHSFAARHSSLVAGLYPRAPRRLTPQQKAAKKARYRANQRAKAAALRNANGISAQGQSLATHSAAVSGTPGTHPVEPLKSGLKLETPSTPHHTPGALNTTSHTGNLPTPPHSPIEEKKEDGKDPVHHGTAIPGELHTETKAETKPGETPAHPGTPSPSGEHLATPKTKEEEERDKAEKEAKEKAYPNEPAPAYNSESTGEMAPQRPSKTDAAMAALSAISETTKSVAEVANAMHPGAAPGASTDMGGMGGMMGGDPSGMGGMGGMGGPSNPISAYRKRGVEFER